MTQIDPAQEWLRLAAVYGDKTDVELQRLYEEFADLTDVAREVLTAEMASRGIRGSNLKQHSDSQAQSHPIDSSGAPELEDLLLGGVTVAECETRREAELLSFVLNEAKIRSTVRATQGPFDLTVPQVRVAPEDAERAAEVLAKPISEGLRREFAEMSYDNAPFASQHCPRCNSNEILLQPENPACLNDWLCAACGHSWQDNLPADWKSDI